MFFGCFVSGKVFLSFARWVEGINVEEDFGEQKCVSGPGADLIEMNGMSWSNTGTSGWFLCRIP